MELELIAKIVSPILTVILGVLLQKYTQDRPRLINYLVHASAIPLRNAENGAVNVHSIMVRNTGKRTANNVRIGHYFLPQSYALQPQLQHEVINQEGGPEAEILIPTLVPNEQVNISYLYFPPVTWNQIHSYCKSDESSAENVNVIPTPQLNTFQRAVGIFVLFVGASTLLYWGILLVAGYLK